MNRILISTLVFLSFFFVACSKPEVALIEKDVVVDNKTVKSKFPAIKEFVLSNIWEFRSPSPSGQLIKLTFQENDVLTIDNFQIKNGIADETKPVSTSEFSYKVRNESEIEVNYDIPLIVKKISEEEISMNCSSGEKYILDPPFYCFFNHFQKVSE